MKKIRRYILIFSVFCSSLILFMVSAPAYGAADICVVADRVSGPYEDAFESFKQEIEKYMPNIHLHHFEEIQSGKLTEKELADKIYSHSPDIVFVIGTESALFVKKNTKNIPIVFCMVLDPLKTGVIDSFSSTGSDGITGVVLDIPPERQFKILKELFPEFKKLGVMCEKGQNEEFFNTASEHAGKYGIMMIKKELSKEFDIKKALASFKNEIDCLWAFVDPFVYNAAYSRTILLFTLRYKMPFVAFSSAYVKAGALMALECDYADIGRQAALQVEELIKGRDIQNIPVQYPEKIDLVINERTAGIIGLRLSGEILKKAAKIFGND